MKKLIEFLSAKKIAIHSLVLLGFALVSLVFFYPLLQGKKLLQSDIQQYKGMARELIDHREATGEELYWIDNAYGGMPTYQLGAKFPNDVLTPLHKVSRLLPHPSFLLFLYFVGAYLFLLSFGMPKKYAVFGALAYGFSTYLLIIIQVGHNTKAQAMGYFPFVFAAIHYLFKRKSSWGIVWAALAMGLQIRANHYQMTYYMLILLLVYVSFQAWMNYRDGKMGLFLTTSLKLLLAGLLAISLNATSLLTTNEYTKFSTRGASELTQNSAGEPVDKRSGLSYDYITQYSYGVFESLSLIIPRIQGGGSSENLGKTSALYQHLIQGGLPPRQAKQFVSNVPTYWGDQPILEAPAYLGVVVVFLAVLALFLEFTVYQKWLLTGIILSLTLSWGKNFGALTHLFVNHFPLYDKFRAVSSIQVILEFCFPVLATLGLHRFFMAPTMEAKKALMKTVFIFAAGFTVLYLFKGILKFDGPNDAYYNSILGSDIMNQIFLARQEIYTDDILRAFVFVGLVAGFLTFFLLGKLRQSFVFVGVGLLVIIDLLQVSNRYIDRELFVRASQVKTAFTPTAADRAILKDQSHYRVYEPSLGLQNARTAYFHNAIGGYHGAKPRRFEEVIDLIQDQQKESLLNMLNVKYVLYANEQGETQAFQNPENFGGAWFVNELRPLTTADAVYQALSVTNLKTTALVESELKALPKSYQSDSLAVIELIENHPQKKTYRSNSQYESFIVFSEMYYPNGWTASIDGQPVDIYPVNYILRGIPVPAGSHEIEFRFTPQIIQWGSRLQLLAIVFLLLLVGYALKHSMNQPLKS
ncbi:MAG: YfhO family protein [Flavobacteriaceae bacterium]